MFKKGPPTSCEMGVKRKDYKHGNRYEQRLLEGVLRLTRPTLSRR
jgi:hypothetical protein